jgi:integrase
VRFTEASVKAYEPPGNKQNYTLWDENLPGFGFRVQAGGKKVYYAKYRMGTKQRWIKIGATDKISLSAATKQAKTIFESVANNIDPANTKAKAAAAAEQTFGSAIDSYLEQLATDKRSVAHVRRTKAYLDGYFRALHTIALASIDRATVSRELNLLNKRGPIAANRARATLSAFFNWSIANGLCEHNPVEKTNKNQEKSRDRVLTARELKTVWSNVDDSDYGKIVKLLALTGQRRDEIARLTWNEVNFDEKQIDLPGSRTKNGLPHIIPLSPSALAILKSVDGDGKFVFAKRNNWQADKDKLDEKFNIPHWVLHDLRRTCSTNMGEHLSIPPHVVEAVLNHASGSKAGVAGVYNKATYLKEKREALNRYADYIRTIVN